MCKCNVAQRMVVRTLMIVVVVGVGRRKEGKICGNIYKVLVGHVIFARKQATFPVWVWVLGRF
jgi:hypothetical protein